MAITTTDNALLRLLQLSSAALPVGGYAFSQGLESAVEQAWLPDSKTVQSWLAIQLQESLARVDLPVLMRQLAALGDGNEAQLQVWNDVTLACRETAELRLTDTAMGEALLRLLGDLAVPLPGSLKSPVFVTVFSVACHHWQLDSRAACHGYAWSWLENQVVAATKLVPLGQTDAQSLLGLLLDEIPAAIDLAATLEDSEIGSSLPGLAMASVWHETQYSRLFRS